MTKFGRLGLLCALGLATVTLVVAPVAAQTSTREQVDIEQRAPVMRLAPLSGEAPVVSEAPSGEQAAPQAQAFTFLLNGVNIAGATAYDAAAFEPLYADFVGKEVTLGELRQIADRIETLYRDGGYVATRAIIPPQAISDGRPTIEVYEGQIVFYEINGEIGPVKKQIARLLDNLITGEPARWSELERYLLLARDLPGISLTGTLRSAGDTAPGGVILVVDTARKPVDGFVSMNNQSPRTAGRWVTSDGIAFNSNSEYGERLGAVALLTFVQPKEQLSGFLTYQQNLGGDGLVMRGSATRSRADPQIEPDVDIITSTTLFNLHLEYPVVRSRDFSLWTRGGLETINQFTRFAGSEQYYDKVRVLFAGARGIWRPWGGGLTQFDIQFRQGLEALGAAKSDDPQSRPNPDPRASILRGSLEHYQPIGDYFAFDTRFLWQYADGPLTSLEEMSIGELTIGRGYEAGNITGESGFGFATELRYSHPDFVNELNKDYLDRIEFYGFFDYGRVYDKGDGAREGYEDLKSVGIGVRIQAIRTLYADLYYVIPLDSGLSFLNDRPPDSVRFNITKFF